MSHLIWNEMRDEQGELRKHWRYLQDAWSSMGPNELSSRQASLTSLLRENGVTYNIYSEHHEKDWPLDLLPVVIPSSEWSGIERGVIQRAELQSLIFQDLNGPRRLISEGVVPQEFVFGHPDWLPFTSAIPKVPSIPWLGIDLTRSADGQWKVLADRVQNPSGAGYALQNRVLLSKVFPSLYRESGVHRLVHWFRALRAELKSLAPAGVEDPHVVLLSPGPGHETWFEHSYLAAYMGLTLVRGHDLELRGDRIWLRAMDGDRPVDVILRRVNDAWCDPLYLRPDSLLGVPGLVRAVQAGTVSVVNPLGSGILNNPGLLACLPKACKLLMGEDLILPSIATWWCGEPSSLAYVKDHFATLVLKSVYPSANDVRIFVERLSSEEQSKLLERVTTEPKLWVAQETSVHSTVPAWQNGSVVNRHMVLRTFACGNPRTGYRVMPGGLTRIGASEDELVVSNQEGGISKDTWILSSEPEREALQREAVLSVGVRTGVQPLPSAAAESLFWAGRYLERALVLVRRLREAMAYDWDESLPKALAQALSCSSGGLWNSEQSSKNQMLALLRDEKAPGSLAFDLYWLVWNCRSLRGVIGGEAIGIVQKLSDPIGEIPALEWLRTLETISMQLRALSSTFADWSQDDPRRIFTDLGRSDEWFHLLSLNVQSAPYGASPQELRTVWEVDQGAPPNLVQVGDNIREQALRDAQRPRSLAFTGEAMLSHLTRLPKDREKVRGRPEAMIFRLLSSLALDDFEAIPNALLEFDSALHNTYFVAQATPGWLKV